MLLGTGTTVTLFKKTERVNRKINSTPKKFSRNQVDF